MLRLAASAYAAIVGHAYDGLPDEACGLLLGDPARDSAPIFHPTANAARSSRVYSIGPRDYLDADDAAAEAGLAIIGVVHSHTHTDAYPSPTDIEQAPDPDWHYVIVSLRDEAPVLRSYRIVDGTVTEEPVGIVR
ncbi:MAG TPA: M67 family metallopeptidase [Acidimicrobiales bacterium]|nr:M67 family metallopeptidase [Acidimicrobiales bacterium]